MITSLAELTDGQKADMVASLSIFLASSGSAEEGEDLVTPAKLQAIASASGNSLSESLATLFASVASNAPGGALEAYMPAPGGGGGGYVESFVEALLVGGLPCAFIHHYLLT